MNDRNARPMARALSKQIFEALRTEFEESYKRGTKHGGPELPKFPNSPKGPEMDAIQKMLYWSFDGADSHSGGYSTWSSSNHFIAALEKAVEKTVFDALAIEPCHVTGMHSPDHFVETRPGEGGYICDIQQTQALKNFVEGLATKREGREAKFSAARDLPRKLHDKECCHRVPSQEQYRKTARAAHVWADEIPPSELLERGSA